MTAFTPTGTAFNVNTTTAGTQRYPALTALAGGGFLVVWDDSSVDQGQLLDADGNKVGGEFTLPGTQQEVAGLTTGGFVLTYAASTNIYAQMYSAAGAPVGGPILVPTHLTGSQIHPSVVALANGGFAVSWFDSNPNTIRLQVFDSAGNKPNGEREVVSGLSHDANGMQTSMTRLAGGGFVVAWTSTDRAGSRVYTKNGGAVSEAASFIATAALSDPAVAALSDGGYVMGWFPKPESHIFKVQRYSSTGVPSGAEIVVSTNAGPNQEPGLLGLPDGSFVTVWWDATGLTDDSGDLVGRVYDASGAPVGTTFLIADGVEANSARAINLAATTDGGFAVTWGGQDATSEIRMRLFDIIPDTGPPAAGDDVVGATEDQTANIAAAALTGNDSEPDGDPLTIAGVFNPLHGTVVLNGDGSVGFTPDADFAGTASFDYSVMDLAGNVDTGTVTVNVAAQNDAPRNMALLDGLVLDTATDDAAAGTVSALDPEGNAITYALSDDAGGRFAIDGYTGQISVADIALFDFAGVSEYQVSVLATDAFGAAAPEADLTIILGRVLSGTAGNDSLTASSDRNWYIDGQAGDDILSGRLGNDHLSGGIGDDSYKVRNAGDVVIEEAGEGYDVVRNYVDFTLAANVEELRLLSQAHAGTGNVLANLLVGGGGADTLSGLGGDDQLNGDAGADTLFGGLGADRLLGQDGSDTLFGDDGDDRLEGGASGDTMSGGAGADVLIGGAGRDVMTGGSGADRFNFDDLDFGGTTTSTGDRILDFNQIEGDRISLSAVDANTGTAGDDAFSFIGTAGFGGMAGQLNYFVQSGNTYFAGDLNGDSTADFMVRLVGSHTLTAGSFIL